MLITRRSQVRDLHGPFFDFFLKRHGLFDYLSLGFFYGLIGAVIVFFMGFIFLFFDISDFYFWAWAFFTGFHCFIFLIIYGSPKNKKVGQSYMD